MFSWLPRSREIDWLPITASALVLVIMLWIITALGGNQNYAEQNQAAPYADDNGGSGDAWWHYSSAWIAIFTIVLTGSTLALWWVTKQLAERADDQAELLREQIELARREFVATHRPHVRVRHVRPILRDGEPIRITCLVSNIGATNAHVEAHDVLIAVEPKDITKAQQDRITLFTADLAGGQSEVLTTLEPTRFEFDAEWIREGCEIYVRGVFIYKDDNGVQRQTSIYRKYDRPTGICRAFGDTEYEFED